MAATQGLPNLVEKIAFANYLPLFSRATADTPEPTPGYTISEIEKLTYDYPHHCKQIASFLCRRLEKPSHHIKIKVLKILDHLMNNAHVNLRVSLRKNDSAIKAAVMCTGVADVLTGLSGSVQIRKMAKDLLDGLYSPERIQKDDELLLHNIDTRPVKPFLGALGSGSITDSKFQGFGNSPNTREESVAEKVWSYFDKLSMPTDHANKIINEAIASSVGNYEAVRIPQQQELLQVSDGPRAMLLPFPTKVSAKAHVPGKAGGGWEDSDEEPDQETNLALSEQRSMASIELLDESGSKDQCEEFDFIKNYVDQSEFPVHWNEVSEVYAECLKLSLSDFLNAISQELTTTEETKAMRVLVLLEALLQTEIFSNSRSVQEALTLLGPSLETTSNRIEMPEQVVIKARKIFLILNTLAS